MKYDTTQFKDLILDRLNQNLDQLGRQFESNKAKCGVRFLEIDDFLPEFQAMEISKAFNPSNNAWRELSSFRESKLTSKQFDLFSKILGEITFAIQEPEVVNLFAKITGITNQVGDPGLYAGGLSLMRQGDFLNPHIDNSHDQNRHLYRRLNLLYYVTPDWKLQDGGHLELWEPSVEKPVVVESRFNRMVLMETTRTSWHSVSKVVRSNAFRCCVSNYYFSPDSPNGEHYFHVTEFNGRPEEPVKRVLSQLDTSIRKTLRWIKKSGFGETDLYVGHTTDKKP